MSLPSADTVKRAEQILKGLTREELLLVIAGLLEERGIFAVRHNEQALAALAYDALERREAAAREVDESTFGAYAAAAGTLQKRYSETRSKRVERTLAAFHQARGSHDRIRALRSRLFDLAWARES